MTLEKNKLTQDQKGISGGKDSVLVREVNGDTMVMVSTPGGLPLPPCRHPMPSLSSFKFILKKLEIRMR